jgi:hypothetical protein
MKYSERLKEIREKYSEVTVLEYINDIEIVGVDIKDLVWLINRVEELEKEKDEWKDTAQTYYMTNQELREQNKRYKQALEFYADEENYKESLISKAEYDADGICISNDEYNPPTIYFDKGQIARQALEGEI